MMVHKQLPYYPDDRPTIINFSGGRSRFPRPRGDEPPDLLAAS